MKSNTNIKCISYAYQPFSITKLCYRSRWRYFTVKCYTICLRVELSVCVFWTKWTHWLWWGGRSTCM